MIGYHGSHRKQRGPQRSAVGQYGPGYYFATDRADAEGYGPYVYQAELSMQRPFFVGGIDGDMDRIRRAYRITDEYIDPDEPMWPQIMGYIKTLIDIGHASHDSFERVLEQLGYDGIVVPGDIIEADASGDYVVVFSRDQIADWRQDEGEIENPDPVETHGLIRKLQVRWAVAEKVVGFALMPAMDFLRLTTIAGGSDRYGTIADKRAEARALADYQRWTEQGGIDIPPFIMVDVESGQVVGHEGRSRTSAVINEFGDNAYVWIAVKLYEEGMPIRPGEHRHGEDVPAWYRGPVERDRFGRYELWIGWDDVPSIWRGQFSRRALFYKRDIRQWVPVREMAELVPNPTAYNEPLWIGARVRLATWPEAVGTIVDGPRAGRRGNDEWLVELDENSPYRPLKHAARSASEPPRSEWFADDQLRPLSVSMNPRDIEWVPCGDCYRFAVQEAVRHHTDDDPITVVHGTIYDGGSNRRIPHAWVETADGRAYDWQMAERGQRPIPVDAYRDIQEAEVDYEYPDLYALRMTTATGNYGPWTAEEHRRGQR